MDVTVCRKLGEGSFGKVDLVDFDGELMVRKIFKSEQHSTFDEAYALCLLDGAGDAPQLLAIATPPLTMYTSYSGSSLTLDRFLSSKPPTELVLHVLHDLCVKVQQVHDAGLVHLDLKEDNVLVRENVEGEPETQIIDLGLASLPGRRNLFNVEDLEQFNWMCPEVATGGEVTFAADVYAIGRMIRRVQHRFEGGPEFPLLSKMAELALNPTPRHRPQLWTIIEFFRRIQEDPELAE